MEVILLVGGFGTRLKGTIPEHLPKPLAPVGEGAFLDYLLRFLRLQGVDHLILSTGFGGELIRERYGENFHDIPVSYSHETTPLGTGGAIRQALDFCREKEAFVLNGDCFFLLNYASFRTFLKERRSSMALAVKKMTRPTRYGTIHFNGNGQIKAFREKEATLEEGFISGGAYLADVKWFKEHLAGYQERLGKLPSGKLPFSIETDFFEKIVTRFSLMAFQTDSYFVDIGLPEDYRRFCSDVEKRLLFKDWTLFLDRDGVINRNKPGEYILREEDFHFVEGSLPGLKRLSQFFKRMIVITNQRAVGRGLLQAQELDRIHLRLKKELSEVGVDLDGIFVCPHDVGDGCDCRKPGPGLLDQARRCFPDIDFGKSVFVGDSPSDWETALKVGAVPVALASERQEGIATYSDLGHFSQELF